MKNNVSFEDMLEQLESTVKTLEDGNITLEDSIKLYEKGIALSKECKLMLQNAKQKIQVLKNENYEENDIDADVVTEN